MRHKAAIADIMKEESVSTLPIAKTKTEKASISTVKTDFEKATVSQPEVKKGPQLTQNEILIQKSVAANTASLENHETRINSLKMV